MACFHSGGRGGGGKSVKALCVCALLFKMKSSELRICETIFARYKKYVVFPQENRGLTHLPDVDEARPAENPQQLKLMALAEKRCGQTINVVSTISRTQGVFAQ